MRSKCNQVVLHAEISPEATVWIVFAYPRDSRFYFPAKLLAWKGGESGGGGRREGEVRRTGRLIVEYRGLEELEC